MTVLLTVWYAIWHSTKVQMKLSMARETFKFIILIYPFTFSTIAIFVYGETTAEKMLHYVILGTGFITLWSSIVFSSASDVNRERYYGTLETISASPVPLSIILVGKIIGNTIWGTLSMLLSFFYLTVVYRVEILIEHPWWFLLAFLFVLLSLSVVAFFLAMLFTLSRQAEALANLLQFPVYLLCGFLVPVSALPNWIHPVSYLLTPTWAIELLRRVTALEIDLSAVLQAFGCLIVLNAICLLLSRLAYRKLEKKARDLGNLGVY